MERPGGGLVAVMALGAAGLAFLALLVVLGLRRPAPETFAPSPPDPRPARGARVGPLQFTVDASADDRWRFFSFEAGTLVPGADPRGWDLAFRRFRVVANGGPGFAGRGGIVDLGEGTLEEVEAVPEAGYVANAGRGDTANAAVAGWYDYSYVSHLLTPKPRVYAVRTASGRYAALQFVGYYCPGPLPGCITFRYVYQGAGGIDLRAAPAAPPS